MAPIIQTINYNVGSSPSSGEKYTIILQYLHSYKYWYDSNSDGTADSRNRQYLEIIKAPEVIHVDPDSVYTIENKTVNGYASVWKIEMLQNNYYSDVSAGDEITITGNTVIFYNFKETGPLYLFNADQGGWKPFEDITGGWNAVSKNDPNNGGPVSGNTLTCNASYLHLEQKVYGYGYYGLTTKKAIDFSGYTKLKVHFIQLQTATDNHALFGRAESANAIGKNSYIKSQPIANNTMTYTLGSNYYTNPQHLGFSFIGFHNSGYNKNIIKIDKIWLE